jgi:hypothetical protein
MKNKIFKFLMRLFTPDVSRIDKKQKYPLGTRIEINGIPYTYCKKVKNEK